VSSSQTAPEPAVAQAKPIRSYNCPLCKRLLPATKFEHLPLDTRCNDCVPFREALELRDQLKEQATRDLAACLDLGGAASAPVPKLNELAGYLMEAWGGGRMFAHDWVADAKSIITKKPGTPASQNAFRAIGKIIGEASKQQSAEDLANMTTAELRERNRLLAVQIMLDAIEADKRGVMTAKMLKAAGMEPTEALLEEIRRG